jgi:hypothetical protein
MSAYHPTNTLHGIPGSDLFEEDCECCRRFRAHTAISRGCTDRTHYLWQKCMTKRYNADQPTDFRGMTPLPVMQGLQADSPTIAGSSKQRVVGLRLWAAAHLCPQGDVNIEASYWRVLRLMARGYPFHRGCRPYS